MHENKRIKSSYCLKSAVVIFCDLSGFQQLTVQLGDINCTGMVENLFSEFDALAAAFGLSPLKTNGDQYIVAGFCNNSACAKDALETSINNAIKFALRARNLVRNDTLLSSSFSQLRVGIATGLVLAGQSSRPFAGFDIWGTTVNRAAMLEQYTAPDTIAICEKSYDLVSYRLSQTINTSTSNAPSYNADSPPKTEVREMFERAPHKAGGSMLLDEYSLMLTFQPTQLRTKATLVNAYVCETI
ncbi:adenylate/guanylate cyclase domain-containing protein [Alteromonas abrolhosensis]|uniref:adenylate/guanylate cyclase domain-containing protein n=1 Tax=Alteromonas abrolhosensis TaxID=1892904 RepID=UPI003BA91619